MPKKHTHNGPGAVRIIGGNWRGSKLPVPGVPGLRPTSDRARETLFNWLGPWLPGAACADLFAGTGSLGLEAVSRGAASCVLVESNRHAVAALTDSIARLGADTVRVVPAGVSSFLDSWEGQFDIVFVDPPFESYSGAALASELWDVLDQIVRTAGWVYIEHARGQVLPGLPERWRLHRTKSLGEVTINLFQVAE